MRRAAWCRVHVSSTNAVHRNADGISAATARGDLDARIRRGDGARNAARRGLRRDRARRDAGDADEESLVSFHHGYKALAARGCTVTHGTRGAEAATAGEIALAAALGVRRDGE